ncbi:uncharacterized protein SCHCODRAFT_02622316 [Schizophyllum commune H4-8]|uniref:Uncharacterized protein n=1 Tax=Schizophyllum commune (strain H4-8 / FGSC 9210) TaxID=578458 RepID=D8PQI5_SCHCM|nr:uncharacterized protein SCHCODRAFT_02622316 [Schizophyllum commune H4-8]KAI5893628.1 hypothetical protein SCHCODRAFT_02622316 [Schizophyllum commune H4-8]
MTVLTLSAVAPAFAHGPASAGYAPHSPLKRPRSPVESPCSPRPTKQLRRPQAASMQRSSSLVRTSSFLDLSEAAGRRSPRPQPPRRRHPSPAPPPQPQSQPQSAHEQPIYFTPNAAARAPTHCSFNASAMRISSPLSPRRSLMPARRAFPAGRREPDLHKQALRGCMARSPMGQDVLALGARVACARAEAARQLPTVMSATEELEGLLDDDSMMTIDVDEDGDVMMADD